jgi:hypothetical protein
LVSLPFAPGLSPRKRHSFWVSVCRKTEAAAPFLQRPDVFVKRVHLFFCFFERFSAPLLL